MPVAPSIATVTPQAPTPQPVQQPSSQPPQNDTTKPVVQGEGMNQQQGGMSMAYPTVASPPVDNVVSAPPLGPGAVAPPPPKTPTTNPPATIGMNNAFRGISSLDTARHNGYCWRSTRSSVWKPVASGLFGKSETEKQQIEHYLEQVQIDIAKAELPITNVTPADANSTY